MKRFTSYVLEVYATVSVVIRDPGGAVAGGVPEVTGAGI